MQLLLSRAGLVLNPGQVADLVLAWRQVAGLIASIPHDRPLADDMALNFRLAPPSPGEAAAPPAAGTRSVKPKAKPKAKAKAAPKRRATRSPARKGARRGR
jgi:hypothetical protein